MNISEEDICFSEHSCCYRSFACARFQVLFAQVMQANRSRAMELWRAPRDFEITENRSGSPDVLKTEHALESPQTRQMWRDIIIDGKVSPIKPMCNVAYGRRRSHAKPKCTSAHGQRRRCVEKIDQTCTAKCINSAMLRCNVGQVRFSLITSSKGDGAIVDQFFHNYSAFKGVEA